MLLHALLTEEIEDELLIRAGKIKDQLRSLTDDELLAALEQRGVNTTRFRRLLEEKTDAPR